MSSWNPSKEEREYLNLILGMTMDCLLNKGTADLSTYTLNLKLACNKLERISRNLPKVPVPPLPAREIK